MARNFTMQWESHQVGLPASNFASFTALPTTSRPANAFDASTDEAVYLEGILPAEYTGSGTLKIRIIAVANYDGSGGATDRVARMEVSTEFVTPANSEAGDTDTFGSVNAGSITFDDIAYDVESVTITLSSHGATPTAGDKFRLKVNRDANGSGGTDDLAVDLLAIGYEFYEET